MYRACIDELEKLGAVDHAQAQAALENIEQLERNRTTPEQALRYGGFGAGMGIAAGGVTDAIRGKKMSELYEGLPGVRGGKMRNIAALGAGGAIAGGALPLLRQHMDKHLEMGKLKRFMQENQPQYAPEPDDGKISGPTHGTGMVVTASVKEAVDIRRAAVPGMGGLIGKYFNPKQVATHEVLQGVAQGRPHLMVEKPVEELRTMLSGQRDFANNPALLDQATSAVQKSTRRHELTHYLRGKAGKMEGFGEPGLRNVLKTGREELAAHAEGLKPFEKMGPKMYQEAVQGVVPGVKASVQSAYPQGVVRGALSGSLKPLLPLAERFNLVKKATFTESQYSGGTGGPPFVLVSGLANKAPPRLEAPLGLESEFRKKQGAAKLAFMGQKGSTPGGHLSSGTVQAGPKITAPAGPSIGDIAKPKNPKIQRMAGVTMPSLSGWGRKIPGAMK